MKRMLINATQAEELRVAIADGQKLIDLDLETAAHEQKKANVYKARITRVEHSLEACFVNYGTERHGFLPFKEINPAALPLPEGSNPNSINLKDVLKEGQELIVQVEKEERGTKGAALSTYISLAGRYSVLMPNSPKSGGVSRRISGSDRDQIRAVMDQLNVPKNMGLIIRTAGVDRNIEELQWDLDYLQQLWAAIEKATQERKAPFLIYQESNLIIRALRDYLRDDISEILIDSDSVYQSALEFMQLVMPHNLRKLKLYKGDSPLFTRYQIESQIETAFAREVTLPSGGALVIDHTEALLSIDINSARATKGADIEETAFQTNLEAADEIARQLRIRDLGGLIVIDFIDMLNRGNQRKVEERIRDALSHDRARIQTGRISKFGLLEMSRQRMRPSIGESSYLTCPRCLGHGSIRSVESLALSMLRLIEEEAIKDHTGQILAQAPTTVANFLHNEKREAIQTIEQRYNVPILVLVNPDMHTPRFEIKRLRKAEMSSEPSYLQVNLDEGEVVASEVTKSTAIAEQPAVSGVRPSGPAPRIQPAKTGFWKTIVAFFTGQQGADSKPRRPSRKKKTTSHRRSDQKTAPTQRRGRQSRGDNQQNNRGNRNARKTAKKTSQGKQAKKQTTHKKPQRNNTAGDHPQNNDAANNNINATPRRRGKRGGRKRRPANQQQDGNQANNQNNNNADNANRQQNQQTADTAGKQTTPQVNPAQVSAAQQAPQQSGNQPVKDKQPQSSSTQNTGGKPAATTSQQPEQPRRSNTPTKVAVSDNSRQVEPRQETSPVKPVPKAPNPAENAANGAADNTRTKPTVVQQQKAPPTVQNNGNLKPVDNAATAKPKPKPATAKPAPKPPARVKPSGPSAKPEAVKGIYSLSEPAGNQAANNTSKAAKSTPADSGNNMLETKPSGQTGTDS